MVPELRTWKSLFEKGIAAYDANNLPLAYQEFREAANKVHADSQYNVALMYENGLGTAVDFAKAHEWYRKASVQGDPLAIGNLGMLYVRG